jgi:hypothetical protein
LGTESVRGRRRVPCPPASKKAFKLGFAPSKYAMDSQTAAAAAAERGRKVHRVPARSS